MELIINEEDLVYSAEVNKNIFSSTKNYKRLLRDVKKYIKNYNAKFKGMRR